LGINGNLGDSFHIESHAALLRRPATAYVALRTPDAIIVPTIWPHALQTAAMLASEIDCTLVVLCSTPEQARQASSTFGPAEGNVLVTYVPRSFDDILPLRLTFRHPQRENARSCHIDIARKRNVGILLARLCGWRTIMYLDDDIRGVTANAVSGATSLAADSPVAGFRAVDFPDNSVVCHAHRLTGGQQDVFPGGSALVVDVDRYCSLFPPVYNEDWFFLFDAVQNGSVAVAGSLEQVEYQPFANPDRAATEEFGDVIAEGLYRLIHEGADLTDATIDYWKAVLQWRGRLIEDIAARPQLDEADPVTGGCALMSLAAARQRLVTISALDCVSFIRAWRVDRDAWREKLLGQPEVGGLADAAKFLGLHVQDRSSSGSTFRIGA